MDMEFINYEAISSGVSKEDLRAKQICKNILETMECERMTFIVFERYARILFGYCPIKGKNYDDIVSIFTSAQGNEDAEIITNFNAFAKDECKILNEKFFEVPFHPDL